jgi:hypothetical protein
MALPFEDDCQAKLKSSMAECNKFETAIKSWMHAAATNTRSIANSHYPCDI